MTQLLLFLLWSDIKESVANSLKGMPEVKAYVAALNKYKQHMSGENLMLLYCRRLMEIV